MTSGLPSTVWYSEVMARQTSQAAPQSSLASISYLSFAPPLSLISFLHPGPNLSAVLPRFHIDCSAPANKDGVSVKSLVREADRRRANLSTTAGAGAATPSLTPGGPTAAISGGPAAAAAGSTTTAAMAPLPPERKASARGELSSGTSRRGDFVGLIERLELENRMGPTVGGSSSDASASGEEEEDNDDDDDDDGSEAEGDGSETARGAGAGGGGSGGSGSDAAGGQSKSKPKAKKKRRKRERRHSFDYEDDFIDDSALVEAYYAKVRYTGGKRRVSMGRLCSTVETTNEALFPS